MEVIVILLLCYVLFYLPIKLVVKLVKYIDKKIYEKEQRKKLEITTNINVETECNNDCDVVNYDEVKKNVVNNTENNAINNNINETQEIIAVVETKVEEIEIDDDKIYWEDLDLLAEIEKLETKEVSGVSDYPFYKQFQEDVFYETKYLFPKTKEDLEEKGYFDIREERGYKQKDWIEELKCFKVVLRGFKKFGKYKVRVDFDITRNRIYPIYASDEETKKPSPRIYYFEELEDKIDEICSLANVTTNKDGLKYYSFGSMMSPAINIRFKEYWNEPQTRKDFQKLGCTSIEYDGSDRDFRSWTCYKQIGNKVLRLYFPKFNRVYCNYAIWSISEIPQEINEEYKQDEVKQKPQPKPYYVYLMGDGRSYKIGISNNVQRRLKDFQTGNPYIKIITYKKFINQKEAEKIEKMLHQQYAHCNVGLEWFNPTDDELTTIKALLS